MSTTLPAAHSLRAQPGQPPAVVATSVIPAYAASICGDLQAMMQGGSTYFFWGEAETTSATGAYWDLNSTQLEITGLALQ